MEQNNGQEELVDLSQVLNENEPPAADKSGQEEDLPPEVKIPGLYGVVAKLSRGLIKNEKQAKAVLVILIILLNAITFSLIFGNNKTGQQIDMQAEMSEMQAAN